MGITIQKAELVGALLETLLYGPSKLCFICIEMTPICTMAGVYLTMSFETMEILRKKGRRKRGFAYLRICAGALFLTATLVRMSLISETGARRTEINPARDY